MRCLECRSDRVSLTDREVAVRRRRALGNSEFQETKYAACMQYVRIARPEGVSDAEFDVLRRMVALNSERWNVGDIRKHHWF